MKNEKGIGQGHDMTFQQTKTQQACPPQEKKKDVCLV